MNGAKAERAIYIDKASYGKIDLPSKMQEALKDNIEIMNKK